MEMLVNNTKIKIQLAKKNLIIREYRKKQERRLNRRKIKVQEVIRMVNINNRPAVVTGFKQRKQ